MKTLKDAKVGETVTVSKLHGEGPVKRRIRYGHHQGRGDLRAGKWHLWVTQWS